MGSASRPADRCKLQVGKDEMIGHDTAGVLPAEHTLETGRQADRQTDRRNHGTIPERIVRPMQRPSTRAAKRKACSVKR